ncbi:MAG TPA: hypothetical protein VFT95_11885 [Micromonosporaceae bacterium]|nr:hypothetical protein [Micromonosporaceae bacterium]
MTRRLLRYCGVAALLAVPLLVPATPASAVPGVNWNINSSGWSSASTRTVKVDCPSGQRVLGGGGWANDNGARTVMLTELRPIRAGLDSFQASAVEPTRGFSASWQLNVYAICAPAPAGHEIREASTSSGSPTFAGVDARCGSGRRAIQAGARITTSTPGTVALHMVRTDGPLTIGRATARETTSSGVTWSLTAYVVCVSGVPNQHVEGQVSAGPDALMGCRSGRLHGIGGGGGLYDMGPYWIQGVVPNSNLGAGAVYMTGAIPEQMAMHITCAT